MSDGIAPRATIVAAMTAFRGLPRAERYGRVSRWTMYYLGALIVPAIGTGVRTGRVPPTAIDALTCVLDGDGHVVGFRPRHDATPRAGHGFDELVDHLAVMIEICADLGGFPARVAWSNAAVMMDHAMTQARGAEGGCDRALREAEALASRHPHLKQPFRGGVRRERRICCLRYLMADSTLCPDICPRAPRPRGTNSATFP